MIIVSGTGRSGTSLWMQILDAAGVVVLGEAFPERYSPALSSANQRGFHETCLVSGVNFTTNPHPVTGAKLEPELTRDWAVKVLSFGLRRTERVYLDKVLLTVRSWRSFGPSLRRLMALESLPPELEVPDPALYWFLELHQTLGDARRRGYPLRVVTYEQTLADPAHVVPEVLDWLGVTAPEAVEAVEPRLASAEQDPRPDLPPHTTQIFDDLYASLAAGRVWDGDLSARCEALAQELRRSRARR